MTPQTPLDKAVAAFIWTLYVRCQHDFEGHDLAEPVSREPREPR